MTGDDTVGLGPVPTALVPPPRTPPAGRPGDLTEELVTRDVWDDRMLAEAGTPSLTSRS